MSTAYAFAAVTTVLRARISAYLTSSGVSSGIGGATVTAMPPDRVRTGAQEANGLNLFLHRASRNQGWANAGPPPTSAAGDAVAATPFGANLHYLVSAYGQDPLSHEILLGHAVAALHEEPVLARGDIRRALAPSPPDPTIPAAVSSSALADQVELLKITLSSPTSEELSRFWASFSAPYRPSLFFDVSVVLVDPMRGFRAPLPVARVGATATDLNIPVVDSVAADGPTSTPITATSTLVITGRHFTGDGLQVRVGTSVATPADPREDELRIPVSDFVPALRARLAGLVVSRHVPLGDPPVGHDVLSSDAAPVSIRPTVGLGSGAVAVTSTQTVDGVPTSTGSITIAVAPEVAPDQQVELLLSEAGPVVGRPAWGAALPAPQDNGVPSGSDSTGSITFGFTRLPRAPYLVRLRVDGVDSPLVLGASGQYDAPRVAL